MFPRAAVIALALLAMAAAPGRAAECALAARPPSSPAESALRAADAALSRGEGEAAEASYREAEGLARRAGEGRLTWIAAAGALRAAALAGRAEGVDARLGALAEGEVPDAFRPALLLNLARTWTMLGEADAALAASAPLKANALLRRALQLSDAPRIRSAALGERAVLYHAAGRLGEARELTRRALFEAARADAPELEFLWHGRLGRIERDAAQPDRALGSFRRAVALLDEVRGELSSGGELGHDFQGEVERSYLDLVDALLRRAEVGGPPATEGQQAALREARDALESLKAAELRDYYGDPCLAAQTETAAESLPGVVVLYPVVLPDRVELIVSSDGVLRSFRAPVDGPTLIEAARRFRVLLPKRTTRQYLPLAHQLYDWLIRPAAPVLSGRQITALVVVPGGALRTIPFAALRDERLGLFLAEKVPVATAPGLTLTDPRRIDAGRVEALVAGITEAVQGYPALPSVGDEVAGVGTHFESASLLDADFAAERFAAAVRERPFGIVHVASHGEFHSDAGKSFVLAYDRKLSMEELGDVVGRTRLRTEQPLELLTLSACQTAAGDDRAALGLAGVALRAGARSALATLWSVSDEASARLVGRFYTELAAGTSRAEALRRAQLELLETRAFRHPGYWAPFLMINSWL